MKTLISLAILAALLIVSCTDTPLAPLKSDNQSYQLIKLPPKAGLYVEEDEYFVTKTINGNNGGELKIKESYVAEDGHTVKIDVKFKIKKNSFSGEEKITMTVDDEYAAVWFTPHMEFSKANELNVKFEGIDLNELISGTGDYDFIYISDGDEAEEIDYNRLVVKENNGEISVEKAKINHFSRYAFCR